MPSKRLDKGGNRMEIVKEICFWIVLSGGLIVCLIGIGMLIDNLIKRYLVYKEIYVGFIEYLAAKMRNERKRDSV